MIDEINIDLKEQNEKIVKKTKNEVGEIISEEFNYHISHKKFYKNKLYNKIDRETNILSEMEVNNVIV